MTRGSGQSLFDQVDFKPAHFCIKVDPIPDRLRVRRLQRLKLIQQGSGQFFYQSQSRPKRCIAVCKLLVIIGCAKRISTVSHGVYHPIQYSAIS
jgi:hypothetical protein